MSSEARRPRVLVVEDDPTVRRAARRLLEKRGAFVLDAETAEAALTLLGVEAPLDLLVTDVVLPGADGPTLARRLRERDASCPIVFMSGYGLEAAQRRGSTADSFFLDKPFTPRSFYDVIERALPEVAPR